MLVLGIFTFHGRRIPLKKSGIHNGSTTASLSSFFASVSSAISVLELTTTTKANKRLIIFSNI